MCRRELLTAKAAKNGRGGREEKQVPPLRFPFPCGNGKLRSGWQFLFGGDFWLRIIWGRWLWREWRHGRPNPDLSSASSKPWVHCNRSCHPRL